MKYRTIYFRKSFKLEYSSYYFPQLEGAVSVCCCTAFWTMALQATLLDISFTDKGDNSN